MNLENLQFSLPTKTISVSAFLCLILLLCFPGTVSAQLTTLNWDRTYGGNGWEELRHVTESNDGNIILLGSHTSNMVGGSVSEVSNGYNDYWLMKVNPANGNIIWDHSYGGDVIDAAQEVHETEDGGFIMGGWSSSGANGDKSEGSAGGCWNCFDYWVVRTDANGTQLWDETYQANGQDELNSIMQTSDGGYIMGVVMIYFSPLKKHLTVDLSLVVTPSLIWVMTNQMIVMVVLIFGL